MTSSPSKTTVHVLLFARYAEVLGADALSLELPTPATVDQVVAALRARPGGEGLPPQPLCAVNMTQATPGTRVTSGDEVALLPPLAGG
ncbi:MAG: MoaD/ThiS family protein [Gemmatimonadales bacterium]|nr:MoaD/ThiS family protein [Gemmatimonadales bacterium]